MKRRAPRRWVVQRYDYGRWVNEYPTVASGFDAVMSYALLRTLQLSDPDSRYRRIVGLI